MDYGFETWACNDPDAAPTPTGDVVTPLHLSTTFEMSSPGEGGYKYNRFGNPTREAVESKLARLEGADHGLALSSGMAAISTVCFATISPGDHVVASEALFGGTVSFEVDGDAAETRAFFTELAVFNVAVSLGGVESLIEHTATMSASNLTAEQRREAGITDSLVKAPVGVEDPDDLIADLDAALGKL